MVPIGLIGRLSGGHRDFLEGGDEVIGTSEKRIHIGVCLALKITHIIAENISEVDQKQQDHQNTGSDRDDRSLLKTKGFKKSIYHLTVNDNKNKKIKCGIGKKKISNKKEQVKQKMFSFYMADFMGNHRIDLFGLKKLEKRIGNQNISELFRQTHHACRNHSTAEYGPVENICISQSRFFAELFDASANNTGFDRFAPPEPMNQGGAEYGCTEKKKQEIDSLPPGRSKQLFRQLKGKCLDDISDT